MSNVYADNPINTGKRRACYFFYHHLNYHLQKLNIMGHEIKETIEVTNIPMNEKKSPGDCFSTDVSSVSTEDGEKTPDGYVHDLEWTPEEERAIINKIDVRLMSFALLMSFVLHMDRTNIGKSTRSIYSFLFLNIFYSKRNIRWSSC